MDELSLIRDADTRAAAYLAGVAGRRVFPDEAALAALSGFAEPLPRHGRPAAETLEMLDRIGGPATVTSTGPRYFGFVIGGALPVAAAAERVMLAWDQCASSFDNSPVAAVLEKQAGQWLLEALDLPRDAAVGFGTSAAACGLACLAAARRSLLARKGWDFDRQGLAGSPPIRAVVSETVHITVRKALRVLGFGLDNLIIAPTDEQGRIDPDRLPPLDDSTILCLQAGEVNMGEFDPFIPLIHAARAAGAWVHVDGAFGLWARLSADAMRLTAGLEGADSWTTDGHKWLNTPYDGAIAICRDAHALAAAMNSDAAYATADPFAQKNLTLEFSRRARGIPIWAALRSLGIEGIAALVDHHRAMARRLADGLRATGFRVLNRVILNQVLIQVEGDSSDGAQLTRIRKAAEASGEIWFGPTVWRGHPAARLSVSNWRTGEADIDHAIAVLAHLRETV